MIKCSILEQFISYTKIVSNLVAFLTRITIAGVFVFAGWGKLLNLERTIDYFASIGMPMAQFLAPIVGASEFLFGLLILVGFATRIAAIPLVIIMTVAILTAKLDEISSLSSLFEITDFLYIVLLLWLVVQGAGKISIDYYLRKKMFFGLKV